MGFLGNAFAAVKRGITNACTAVTDTISSIPKKFKDFTRKAVRTLKRTAVKINAALPVIRCHLVKTINSILDWIKAHPYLTAFVISIIVAMTVPAILGFVGFTAAGPLAGKTTKLSKSVPRLLETNERRCHNRLARRIAATGSCGCWKPLRHLAERGYGRLRCRGPPGILAGSHGRCCAGHGCLEQLLGRQGWKAGLGRGKGKQDVATAKVLFSERFRDFNVLSLTFLKEEVGRFGNLAQNRRSFGLD